MTITIICYSVNYNIYILHVNVMGITMNSLGSKVCW